MAATIGSYGKTIYIYIARVKMKPRVLTSPAYPLFWSDLQSRPCLSSLWRLCQQVHQVIFCPGCNLYLLQNNHCPNRHAWYLLEQNSRHLWFPVVIDGFKLTAHQVPPGMSEVLTHLLCTFPLWTKGNTQQRLFTVRCLQLLSPVLNTKSYT